MEEKLVNKAKQIIRVENQHGPKKNYDPEARKNKLTLIGIGIAAVLFIAMCVVIFYEALHKDPVLVIGDEKYYATDVEVMYNVYMEEANVEQYAQLMNSLYNGVTGSSSIWNTGSTKTLAKQEAMNKIINYELMYREATKNGVTLTEDEKKEATDKATTIIENMNSKRLKRTGFTKESFVEYALKAKLAEKYIAQVKEGYGITKDTLETPVKQEEYEERKIEVIYVATATSNSDDDAVPVSDEKKAEYKAQIEEYLKQAKDGKEFKDILAEDEETFKYSAEMSYVVDNTELPEELIAGTKDLKDGQITDKVIEAKNYYFIAKMIDDNPTDAYEKAIKDAIETEQTAKFEEEISKLKTEYKLSIGKGWDAVEMGSTAVLIGEDISELSAGTTSPSPSPEASTSPAPEATASPESK